MTTNANRPEAGAAESRQVLTFVLGSETYGVDILRVQDVDTVGFAAEHEGEHLVRFRTRLRPACIRCHG